MRIALIFFPLFFVSCSEAPDPQMEARHAKNRADVARQMGMSQKDFDAMMKRSEPKEPTIEERHRASVEEKRRDEADCRADPGSIYC